jgi:hypothetical protein
MAGVPGPADPIPGIAGSIRAGDVMSTALAALAALAELGETVEDEWTYVTKLAEMGRLRIRAVVPDPDELVPAETTAAIDALADEAGRITDPHRAIDWLSTLPAVAELALGAGRAVVSVAPPAVGG